MYVAAIQHNPLGSQVPEHYSSTGERLYIDADRSKVGPGHNNINALSYHTQSPSFNPWPNQIQGNHVTFNGYGGGTITEASAGNSLAIPYSSNTSRAINLDSYQVLSSANGYSEVKLNLSGGGGKYEVFVPGAAEYIYLPLTGNSNISLPYWRYHAGDNQGEASLTVTIPSNQASAVRVRSAYDYDDYPGLGNRSYDNFEWVSDQNFVNTYTAFCNNSNFYTEFSIQPNQSSCNGITDGTILGTWNISIPNYTAYPQLKARVMNGQMWVTQVVPTDNPNIPEGYGKEDAFVVRGKNMLGRGDVTNYFGSGIQGCFAGEETGYGGLAIPSAANPFSPLPSGYQFAYAGDGTPYYYKNSGPCSQIADGTVLGTWNISIPNYPGYPELKARYFNGGFWVTQVVPTNVPGIPEGYGKADVFVVRGKNMLSRGDVSNYLGSGIIGCFMGEETGYGGLAIPSAANPWNPIPAGHYYAISGDNTPYYYKNAGSKMPFQDESLSEEGIHLYPNPSSGMVRLAYPSEGIEPIAVEVRNLQGKVLKTFPVAGSSPMEFSLEELPAGSYLIRLVHQGGSSARMLLKQ